MTNQVIPIKQRNDVLVDETLIRLVNENHDRHVRERQAIREMQIRQQQERAARRAQFMNNLYYTLFGVTITLGVIALLLMIAV